MFLMWIKGYRGPELQKWSYDPRLEGQEITRKGWSEKILQCFTLPDEFVGHSLAQLALLYKKPESPSEDT